MTLLQKGSSKCPRHGGGVRAAAGLLGAGSLPTALQSCLSTVAVTAAHGSPDCPGQLLQGTVPLTWCAGRQHQAFGKRWQVGAGADQEAKSQR